MAMPETRPTPVLGPLHQVRPWRIPLGVTANGEVVIVFLHRKRLESALIYRAGPLGTMVSVPATHMGRRQPLWSHRQPRCPFAQRSIATRPDGEMSMVRQQREAHEPPLRPLPCLTDHLLECRIIGRMVKQSRPPHRPIERMLDTSGSRPLHVPCRANTKPNGVTTVRNIQPDHFSSSLFFVDPADVYLATSVSDEISEQRL